ncbi:MAG: 50S ribosomal protein L9 [Rhizobiales bacterium]|nr:50S ribosomal protein L9 [Hyphomicrobiales bacterium]
MQIILLERIAKLGALGDEVTVKDGFARNFLLPQGKALRANKVNKERFESQRAELETKNADRKQEADAIFEKLNDTAYMVIRSAGETGQLYGSVSPRDISNALEAAGFKVARSQIALPSPIKTIGMHPVEVTLHPEVLAIISMNVARSEDEAERQAAGEDLSGRSVFDDQEEDDIDLSDVFDSADDEDGDDAGEDASDEVAAEETTEDEA